MDCYMFVVVAVDNDNNVSDGTWSSHSRLDDDHDVLMMRTLELLMLA